MSKYVRLSLPCDISDELVDDGTAVQSIITRGQPGEVLAFAVDVINTGSAAVSIAVSTVTCKRLAQAFVRRLHRDSRRKSVILTVTTEGRAESLEVDMNSPDAEDKLFDFFVDKLHVD